MRALRYGFLTVAAFALAAWIAPAYAFHSGGVAECEGCHSMHEAASTPLLKFADPSSTCLDCHESAGDTGPSSYHISTPAAELTPGAAPKQRTPGGDFAWLRLEFSFVPRPNATPEMNYGRAHGHNVVADDYGYVADDDNTVAPGGTMLSTELGCESCHDPHGQSRRIWNGTASAIVNPNAAGAPNTYPPIMASGSYHNSPNLETAGAPTNTYAVGIYRILGGNGYMAYDSVTYPGAPMAVVNSTYNRSEWTGSAVSNTRVAYGHGTTNGFTSWSQWCGTCHTDYHSSAGGGELEHPTEAAMPAGIKNNYNRYIKTGDLSGAQASSFTSLVPFATNTVEFTSLSTLATNGTSAGPDPSGVARMACLSCHRAHAGAWDYALRWNYMWEFLTLATTTGQIVYPASDNTTQNRLDSPTRTIASAGAGHRGYSNAQMEAAYYDRPATVFSGYQRQLCNKCHIKD